MISDSLANFTKLNSHEIVFYLPSFIFKCYLYVIRIYIKKEIWNNFIFCNNLIDLNENYFFDLNEDYQLNISEYPNRSNINKGSNRLENNLIIN